ncbi:MAG: hypothetical protein ABWY78_22695 [Microvirga sp.]
MSVISRSGIGLAALLAGMAAFSCEPAVMRGFSVGSAESSLTVGTVRTSLWAAMAQSADAFGLDDVTFKAGSTAFRMKRIDFKGVTAARSDIQALFDPASTASLSDRLARIDASQVTIPELVIEQAMPGWSQTTTYRNVSANDIRHGLVAAMTADTAAQELTLRKGKSTVTQGRSTINGFDLAALARLYLDRAGPDPAPLARIYGSFSIADTTLADANGATIRIASMTGSDFRARPTADSWSGTLSLLVALSEMDARSAADEGRLITALTDLIDAMDFGSLEAGGIEIANAAARGTTPATSRIERVSYRGARDGQTSEVMLQGLKATSPDSSVALDTLTVTGFSLRPTIDGLRALRGRSVKDLPPEEMRALIPVLGTTKLAGLSFDVPNSADKSPSPARIKASLKAFELTADKPVDGIASRVRLGVSNLAMALPAASDEEGIKTLIDWGYKDIDVSFLVSTEWNAAASAIEVRDLSFQGKDMGDVTVRGTLGNVSKDVFDPDTAVASVALMAATIRSLDVTLENKGLFDRYLARAAQDQRTKPETLRRTYGTAAAFLIPSMIGNSDQARIISKAVSRFIAKPGRISLHATTKDPAGLGVADIAGQPEPGEILKLLDVTATND